MIDFQKINDLETVKEPVQEVKKFVKATYYKTKSGCYTPPPYKLDYCKLSEVLE